MFGYKLVSIKMLEGLQNEKNRLLRHKKKMDKDIEKYRARLRKISQVVCGHRDGSKNERD